MLRTISCLLALSLASCLFAQDIDPTSKHAEQLKLMERIFASGGDSERVGGEIVLVTLLDATNETFELLKDLKHVKYLDCSHCRFDGAGLENIAQMKRLEKLHLNDNTLAQRHLVHIGDLPLLRMLTLENTNLTDCGLRHLQKLQSLEELYLGRTTLTDKSVALLSNFKKLKSLDLKDTDLTPSGVEKLKRLLPKCSISYRRREPGD